jgi:alpha-galactosidase
MKRRNFLAGLLSAPAILNSHLVSNIQRPRARGKGWTIVTEKVVRELVQDRNGLRLIAFKNKASGYDWIKESFCDFAFKSDSAQFEGLSPSSGFRLVDHKSSRLASGATELLLVFENQAVGLKLSLFFTSFPGTSVIEQRCKLENVGTQTISNVTRFDPIFFKLAPRNIDLQVHAVRRSKYALELLPIGDSLEIRGGGWNKPEHAGFVCIEDTTARELMFFGVEWERDWAIRFNPDSEGISVSAGIIDINHDLKPGTALESPRIFIGLVQGNLDDAARAKDDYLKKYVIPPKLDKFPWVVYDIWGTEKENVESMILDELDFASKLGVEHMYIDASWYEGSSKRGTGDWGCGLGRYREDRQKFPRGLAYIASRAHERNMTFGLWVDPVVLDQRLVPNEVPHKWVGQKDGKDNVLTIKAWESPVVHLCLGSPEATEHVKTNLSRIISEFNLDWMKWDNSGLPGMPVVCNRDDHGHQKGDGSYAAQRNLYSIWSYLHEKYPKVVFEQCGYGSRHDFGLARYCRANWLSDSTYPSSHVRENASVASYLYPSFYNGGWIVLDPETEKQKDPAVLDTIFRSRMLGLFGFGTLNGKLLTERISLFPGELIEAARRNIPCYKKYRHLLAEDCFHLTPPTGGAGGWQAIEFCKRDGAEAVAMVFRGTSTQERFRLKLLGLRSTARYRVRSENDKTEISKTGAQLATEGLIIILAKVETSDVLTVNRV